MEPVDIKMFREETKNDTRIIFTASSPSSDDLLYYAESRISGGYKIKDSANPTDYSDSDRDILYQMMILAEGIE